MVEIRSYSIEMLRFKIVDFQGPDPISLPGCCASSGDRPCAMCFGYIFMYSEATLQEHGAGELDRHPGSYGRRAPGALVVFIEHPSGSGPDSDSPGLGDPVQGGGSVGGDGLTVMPLRLLQPEGIGFPIRTRRSSFRTGRRRFRRG